ncbi:LptA/OstA family protein [Shinella zoogloeoides]|jgi:lipopolysaccharide export system protein LptA|uniref:LptA/OstA family protein n=1 Tax=Shinella zoogloeoides TaxID=352475 RepID=UPI00273E0390|nr:LptA/OstA family protein [Shinella zoogloeoides]WLR92808.1 LptA/OstA family protein [Shinella zoogloeoides]
MFASLSAPVRAASLFVLAAGLALAAGSAGAQQTSSRMKGMELSNDQPIQIQSDKLEIQDQQNKAEFTGNVKVVQGTTTLQAGRMVVYYKSGGGSVASGDADIEKIDVFDKVYLKSQTQEATADTGTFNMVNETLLLKGKKVVLSEGENVFVGCQLHVTMRTGEAKLDACGGRVMIQLDPKSRKQTN